MARAAQPAAKSADGLQFKFGKDVPLNGSNRCGCVYDIDGVCMSKATNERVPGLLLAIGDCVQRYSGRLLFPLPISWVGCQLARPLAAYIATILRRSSSRACREQSLPNSSPIARQNAFIQSMAESSDKQTNSSTLSHYNTILSVVDPYARTRRAAAMYWNG